MSRALAAVREQFYIIDLDGGGELHFMAMPPPGTGFGDSKSVNWKATPILGRSSPIQGYANSEPRSLTVPIHLHSSVEQDDPTSPEDVKDACNWIASLAYPDYRSGVQPPHRLWLHLGDQVQMIVVLTRYAITYLEPWDPDTGLAYNAVANCSFIEVDLYPKDCNMVRGGGTSG